MNKKLMCFLVALGVLGLAGPVPAQPDIGKVLFDEWYASAINNDLDTLKAYPDFPDNPHRSYWGSIGMDRPDGGEDYWGGRGRAYLYPPQTGDYTFWIATDDDGELHLSTDDDPAKKVLIASVEGWMPYRDFANTGGGSPGTNFKSQPVRLEAGKRYYMETLWSDGTAGGFMTVAWGGPGIGAGPKVIEAKYFSAYLRDPEPLLRARKPDPADGTIGVPGPILNWTPGETAVFHDVYFGTEPDPPLVMPGWLYTTYFHFGDFQPGVRYYWKIDEIERDGVTKYEGTVWSFVSQSTSAYYPQPEDQAQFVSPGVTLTWMPGLASVKHHLYLGDSLDAVTQGTVATDKGELTEPNFAPGTLQGATTYYWRVDEIGVDGTVRTGDVWSFSTCILVDDFESYDDNMETGTTIFDTWIDGLADGRTTSQVGYWDPPFCEQVIVHAGAQSMPMDYNNLNSPYFAEAELEFSPPANWTLNGPNDLRLWFRGHPIRYREEAGLITMSGSGHDIWDDADDFRFAWKRFSGNGSIIAKVESLVNTNVWAKAGVMIRESLDPSSPFVYSIVSAASGVSFGWRPSLAGACDSRTQGGIVAPQYVKLTRTGDVFTAQYSADGKTWTDVKNTDGTVASTTIMMSGSIYIGLCVTSHNRAATTTAVFSNVTTSAGISGAWKLSEIGDDPEWANDPQGLYVRITDGTTARKNVTVWYPDPAATNITTWTEWKIPLSSLAGVSLNRVSVFCIGIADQAGPTLDGYGRIYIDDIRVTLPEQAPPP